MSKKIYDIMPGDSKENHVEVTCSTPKEKAKRGFPFPLVIAALATIVIVGLYFIFPGKAEVTIQPKTEDVTADADVTVDSTAAVIDYGNNTVPGIIFTGDNNKTYSEIYQSTGTGDNAKKATGTIRVFNKIKPSKALSLVKGTRFLSVPGGLIYRSDAAFTIPAAKSDGTNGYVDVKVTAAEAGQQYNIQSATFSVPGLNGSEYYANIWAETVSNGAISGGEESQVKLVSKDDLTSAKDRFQNKYSDEAKQALIAAIPQGYEYSAEDIVPQMNNLTVSAKQGDQVDTFTISAQVATQIIVFRKDDLDKLGEGLLKKDLSELKTIVPKSLSYEVRDRSVTKDGKIKITISFKGKIYSMPDNDFLMNSLKGKDKSYSISVLENVPEISKVTIKLSPFWQFKIPNDSTRIKVTADFSGQ